MIQKIILILFISSSLFAQTGIGTTTPDASAKLEVSSANKGFLPPRIALSALNTASPISSPATGLLIFNTATAGSNPNQVTPGYYYWDGVNVKWVRLEDKADNLGNHTATDNIRLNGYYLSNDGGSEGIRVDNAGNVGIGTNSLNTSAILDISSTTKGVLIPRMTAAQRAAISNPIASLLIFQTDAPSDFYYYTGSSWISLREPNWTSAGTIQSVGWKATTTDPIIGTTTVNDYSYKQIGSKTWRCQLTYSAGNSSSGNSNGTGDYLFTLPNGLQFNTSIAGQATISDNVGSSTWVWPGVWLSSSSGSITNLNQGGLLYVVPYSNTQFRLIHVGIAGVGYVIPYASGYYAVGSYISWRVAFTFESV